MKTLTAHKINECNEAIEIRADAPDVANGNASHVYVCTIDPAKIGPTAYTRTVIEFQHGPVKENGVNGITNEILLAILIDRLHGFQSGPYACEENAEALQALHVAMEALHRRTRGRVARGVEGTNAL